MLQWLVTLTISYSDCLGEMYPRDPILYPESIIAHKRSKHNLLIKKLVRLAAIVNQTKNKSMGI